MAQAVSKEWNAGWSQNEVYNCNRADFIEVASLHGDVNHKLYSWIRHETISPMNSWNGKQLRTRMCKVNLFIISEILVHVARFEYNIFIKLPQNELHLRLLAEREE